MKDRAILWIECFEETVSCECFEGKLSKQEKKLWMIYEKCCRVTARL